MAPRKKVKISYHDEANAPHDGAVLKTPKYVGGSHGRRSRKGCLESVQTLPLDVSLQIFGHLHPKDLLNLCRTSRAFRSFFLSRANSISIWKSSLRQVEGLPEKPEFLRATTFIDSCGQQNCGKSGIPNPVWPWFVRCCTSCIGMMSLYLRDWEHESDRSLTKLVHKEGTDLFNVDRTAGPRYIHVAQLEHFVQEWVNTGGDEDQRNALVKRQRRAAGERAVVAQRFEAWHTAQKEHRSAELEDMREQRFQDILDRLRAKWLPELEYFEKGYIQCRIIHVPGVRQPNPLTDRAWPKIRAALQDEMNALRELRLLEQREEQMKERLHELAESILDHYVQLPKTPSMDCRPSPLILLGEKQCFDLVVAPTDREVTRRDFAEVLPEVCSRWQASCAKKLRGLMRASIPTIPEDVDPLDLAVAVFQCDSCFVYLPYPELLAHSCYCRLNLRDAQAAEESSIRSTVAWLCRSDDFAQYKPPSRIKIRVWRPVSSVVRMQHIVSALGLDPTRATREDLKNSDARLRCRVCSPSDGKVYAWERAFCHMHRGFRGMDSERDDWERVSEEDMATVRDLEAKADRTPKEKEVRWGCTLCRDWDSIGPEVGLHMKTKHQLDDWEKCIRDGTVYRHFNQGYCLSPAPVSVVGLPKPNGL